MVYPRVMIWKSMKGVVNGFSTNMGNVIKMGTDIIYGVIPLLNYVKNSYPFAKFLIELVAI